MTALAPHRATTRRKVPATLTAPQLAEMIHRHFPALLPRLDGDQYVAPSKNRPDGHYVILCIREHGVIRHACGCATRPWVFCSHLLAAEKAYGPLDSVWPGERVTDLDARNRDCADIYRTEVA